MNSGNYFRWIVFAVLLIVIVFFVQFRPASVSASPSVAANPNKYALLVGISKYNRGNKTPDYDWWNLHAKNDMEILADVLIRKFQFLPENIRVICDDPVTVGGKVIPATKPTKKAIEDAFRSALIGRVVKGDVAYFHYSGHGSQAPDDNKHGPNPVVGDEADGMDETLIPADYVSYTKPDNDIRDDTISDWLNELQTKEPANVTVTIDSCHSGTATRGNEVLRGSYWKGNPVDPKLLAKRDDSAADFVTSRGKASGGQNYVFISAASPTQPSKEQIIEGVPYGKFTYNLVKVMENAGPSTTYRDLFEKVSSIMSREQRIQVPQIEGSKLDQIVLAEGALASQRYVPVQVSGANVYLKAGRLQGITKGSIFVLYPEGTKGHEEGKEIVKVEIERVNPTSSVIKIPAGVDKDRLKTASRAFEVVHSYNDSLKVAIRVPFGKAHFDNVFKDLGLTEKVPEKTGDWNVLIRQNEIDGPEFTSKLVSPPFRGYVIERRDGSVVKAIDDGPNTISEVTAALRAEAMWQLVKSLDDTQEPNLQSKIELSLIPVKIDFDEVTGEPLGISDATTPIPERGGKKELRACTKDPRSDSCIPNTGDAISLEIINTSDRPLWVTVLNLRSDAKIGPAFPRNNADNKIAPGTTFRIPDSFRITPPFGEESFRAIVTANHTDFSSLIDPDLLTRGDETPGERNAGSSPLGMMLRQAARGKRGDPMAPPASWATAHVTFYVVP